MRTPSTKRSGSAAAPPDRTGAAAPFAAAGATALAAALAFWQLGAKSLWLDEGLSAVRSGLDFADLLPRLFGYDANSNLHALLLHLWIRLFGDGEAALRSLSAIAAVGCVPLVYLLASRLFGRWPGAAAAVLLALNGFFLHYAQESRCYALLLLLTCAQSLLFLRALERSTWVLWLGYAALGGLAVYAHAAALLNLPVHVLAALSGPPRAPDWRRFAAALALTGAITAPQAWFLVHNEGGQLDWVERPGLSDLRLAALEWTGYGGTLALLLAALAIGLGAVVAARRNPPPGGESWAPWGARWALIGTVGVVLFVFAISQARPALIPRYLIAVVPGLVLLYAAALALLRPRWAALALFAVLAFSSARGVHYWYTEYQKEDFRAATAFVLERLRPGDAITFYVYMVREPFEYYARRAGAGDLPVVDVASAAWGGGGRQPAPDLAKIHALAREYPRVWLVLSHAGAALTPQSNSRTVQREIQRDYIVANVQRFQGITVMLYQRR
ncbi:MAG: glycosyltransferase family 39 protein [Acidobacteria bacterium]|nr:glycosyltransferase family 39 protein [Acidobacteriota bacterium]